jgi:hypothetical protein
MYILCGVGQFKISMIYVLVIFTITIVTDNSIIIHHQKMVVMIQNQRM